jgi:hypothetical protein
VVRCSWGVSSPLAGSPPAPEANPQAGFTRRNLLERTSLVAAGAGPWSEALFPKRARAEEKKPTEGADAVGRREILRGLDGMSRAADPGSNTFVNAHVAAAVIMGHKETAAKGVSAYWQFVEEARRGTDLGGKKVAAAPPAPPSPLKRDYWVEQGMRRAGELVSSRLIKYPYSFYALARDLRDDKPQRRLLEKLYHLTAVS